jgi:tRNA-specific 2-thiouridylase
MKVYVGLSGGVDSSVTAAKLLEQGHDVTGVYMKNWSKDLPGFDCPWKQDYQDAKRVAVDLGIPFTLYDFETEYRQRVVDYMLDGYQWGLTPNPDIMCNQEIKFKLFLETARAGGADMIATGHYAKVVPSGTGRAELHMAADADKDQTYFLYRVTEKALAQSLMPIGEFANKAEVRAEAKRLGLATAEKKDSQGICFVGKVGIKEFLLHEFGEQPHGPVRDQNGVLIGEHDGALFYTIGQRQGLGIGGGLPYYVTGKDMTKNEVYVTTDIQDPSLWHNEIGLAEAHWINQPPEPGKIYQARTRHRAELVEAQVMVAEDGNYVLQLAEPIRALTPGQSTVLYDQTRVVGGGVVV